MNQPADKLKQEIQQDKFTGFKPETFSYFAGLEENNNTSWFRSNRDWFDNFVVNPSKEFIKEIAGFFQNLNPSIKTEPKFGQTMMRIGKDLRFVKENPYRTFLLIHFGKFKVDSEFVLFLNQDGINTGILINNSLEENLYFKRNLPGHKEELFDTFRRYKLNGAYNLHEVKKEPVLLRENFDINNDFNTLAMTKKFLLEKTIKKDNEIIYTPALISVSEKIFLNLYPLYCFSIAPNPLYLIEEFEERMKILNRQF